jgi:hypothetical protein
MEGYPALKPTKKTGAEALHLNSQPLPYTLGDFWRWSASDLVSNATRGVLAEFIVASALGLAGGIRTEWDACDLVTPTGLKIEVKSASYLQSWFHKKPSIIEFTIGPTRGWDARTNVSSSESKRQADVYVFSLLAHRDKDTLDPLNVAQWEFYILGSSVLNAKVPTQKKIRLASLLRLGARQITYGALSSSLHEYA